MNKVNKNRKIIKCNLEDYKCRWKMFSKIIKKVQSYKIKVCLENERLEKNI